MQNLHQETCIAKRHILRAQQLVLYKKKEEKQTNLFKYPLNSQANNSNQERFLEEIEHQIMI